MKLVVQIPAYNEESTIGDVIDGIPRRIDGIHRLEVLVIDDGSVDRTVEVARAHGADHILRHNHNRGLAATFQTGLDASLRLGADIVVNLDADLQYPPDQIPALIASILSGRADIVIGDRRVDQVEHFSPPKRLLHKLGSWVARRASGTSVPDAPSGFRAYSREAALRLFVTTDFSYTLDNLIQAGRRGLVVAHIRVRTNPTRPSRLHRGNWNFVKRQGATIVRAYATYEPLKTFFYLSLPFFLVGGFLLVRIVVRYVEQGFTLPGNLQSLFISFGLLTIGFLILVFGLLADRIGDSRRLMEEILYRLRAQEINRAAPPLVPPVPSVPSVSQDAPQELKELEELKDT
ncbi:MAG TPA: glycosyltransferase family 2 protein [Anaerolineae bacterium]|nr:glycosyltransferase family 2 protein [Anaerolineae bacterium]